jgi:hypothetical protein
VMRAGKPKEKTKEGAQTGTGTTGKNE